MHLSHDRLYFWSCVHLSNTPPINHLHSTPFRTKNLVILCLISARVASSSGNCSSCRVSKRDPSDINCLWMNIVNCLASLGCLNRWKWSSFQDYYLKFFPLEEGKRCCEAWIRIGWPFAFRRTWIIFTSSNCKCSLVAYSWYGINSALPIMYSLCSYLIMSSEHQITWDQWSGSGGQARVQ